MIKRLLLLVALLPIIAVALIAFDPSGAVTRVQFVKTDWDSAKRQAVREGKLFFVDFDASYCATCRNMDETTYMDVRLSEYIGTNVVAHRVDVQDFDGVMWSQTYEVEALPTMLVFDSKGKLVQRLVGYKSANDLLKVLGEVRTKEQAAPFTATNVGMQNETPMNTTTTTTTVNTQPNTTTTTTNNSSVVITDKTTPQPIANNTGLPSVTGSEAASGLGLFEVAARRQESKGFAVQVGVFSSFENALTRADELRQQFTQQRTLLHADKAANGQTIYKLLLGVFPTRRDATNFSVIMRQKKIEGVVKDLTLML